MLNVNGLSPYVRAILDSFEADERGRWECPCGWVSHPSDWYSLLGLVDTIITHSETDPQHN